jgi:hypothetical protein
MYKNISITIFVKYQFNSANSSYCEIIINLGVLFFVDFMVHLNHEYKIQRKTIYRQGSVLVTIVMACLNCLY